MLYGSEMWSLKRENELVLYRAEMRMIRWMCDVKLRDKLSCVELRQQLGIENTTKVIQRSRLCWYRNVLRKDDDDLVKKIYYFGV